MGRGTWKAWEGINQKVYWAALEREDAGLWELGTERAWAGEGLLCGAIGAQLAQKRRPGSLRLLGHCQVVKWLFSAGLCRGKASVPHFVDVETARGSDSEMEWK